MEKKQARKTAKTPARTRLAVKKAALKDLDTERIATDKVKGGTYTAGSRR